MSAQPSNPRGQWKFSPSGRVLGAALFGLALFLLADGVVRTPAVQSRFWDAVARRIPSRDWFMGNVVMARKAKIEEADLRHKCELVLIGSSQVAAGFDAGRLREQLGSDAVRMMSIGDMDSTRVLFALPYLCIGTNDAAVWYVSTRDVAATPPLHLSWMRPFSSWRGVAEILPLMAGRDRMASWRLLPDLFLSASSELWRSRDYSRHVLLNAGGLNDPIRTTSAQDQLQRDMDKAVMLRNRLAPAERTRLENIQFAALDRALRLLAQRKGGRLLVLEGQLNPKADSPENRLLQAKLDAALRKGAADYGYIYFSIADQGIAYPAIDWKDPTHLNAKGREKLTAFLLDYLRRNPVFLSGAIDPSAGPSPGNEEKR